MARSIAVVGAGPAGMAAADRLDTAGARVVVLEAEEVAGGRTRSVVLGPGHRLDAGAAWMTSFYTEALALAEGLTLIRRDVAGTPDLVVDGRRVPAPFTPGALARTRLLSPGEKARFLRWAAGALRRHPRVRVGPHPTGADRIDADTLVRRQVGDGAVEHLLRPAFETMVFAPLSELSADFVEGWVRAAVTAGYVVPADGMDAPWRRLAARLDVRCGVEVDSVRTRAGGGVVVDPVGAFDAAVVAVPAPVAARIVPAGQPGRPPWLDEVRHAAHVLAHAVRPHPDPPPGSDVHPGGPGRHRIGSVALSPGGDGRVPVGMQGATVSAEGWWSAELIDADLSDDELLGALWDEGARLEPALFDLRDATVSTVVRLPHAVPVFGPGHLQRLARWRPRSPIALAGDWSFYPCIEGAVRSGRRAAAALTAP
jgi:oxygen-dependent protoporphyrinogen oxidase